MNYYIITGMSRGIGAAMAARLMSEDNHVIGISRNINDELKKKAENRGFALDQFPFDLSHVEEIETFMDQLMDTLDLSRAERIALINNAGMLEPIVPIHQMDSRNLIDNMHVNLLAPMILASVFIRRTKGLYADTRVLNVSSGAGRHAYPSWSHYCTSKSGLDMFSRCVGLEQGDDAGAVKIFSVAPGVVDTQMQAQIRSADETLFPDIQRFILLKESGSLLTPEEAAQRLTRLLYSKEVRQGDVFDVRNQS